MQKTKIFFNLTVHKRSK